MHLILIFSFLAACLFGATISKAAVPTLLAQTHGDIFGVKEFYYPPKENGIIISNGKFIFAVIDDYRILVGDQIIDFFNFKVVLKEDPKTNDKIPEFHLNVPLFNQGTFIIKDPEGNEIFETDVRTLEIASLGKIPTFKVKGLTLSSNEYEKITRSGFLIVCMSRKVTSTNMEVCSPELVPVSASNQLELKPSLQSTGSEKITINKKVVTSSGEIILSDSPVPIQFKANLKSRASIDIVFTRASSRIVDFNHEPKDRKYHVKATKISETTEQNTLYQDLKKEYTRSLPDKENFFFLQNEGGMPLRYDIFIKRSAPKESNKIAILPSNSREYPKKTYLSSVTIELDAKKNKSLEISPRPLRTKTKKLPHLLAQVTPSKIEMKGLKKGRINYTDVYVNQKKNKKSTRSIQRWYTHRYYPYAFYLSGGSQFNSLTPDQSEIFNSFQFEWYLPIKSVNWSLSVDHDIYLDPSSSNSRLLVNYSFFDNLHTIENNVGLSIGPGSLAFENLSSFNYVDIRFFVSLFAEVFGIRSNMSWDLGARNFSSKTNSLELKKYFFGTFSHRIFFTQWIGMKWGVNMNTYNLAYADERVESNNETEGELGLFFYF